MEYRKEKFPFPKKTIGDDRNYDCCKANGSRRLEKTQETTIDKNLVPEIRRRRSRSVRFRDAGAQISRDQPCRIPSDGIFPPRLNQKR